MHDKKPINENDKSKVMSNKKGFPIKIFKLYCLLTGYLNFKKNDGGTVYLLTLLQKLSNDGFDCELLCLTDTAYFEKHFPAGKQTPDIIVASRDKNTATCYLPDYSFPMTFHSCPINMRNAYAKRDINIFEDLINRWQQILIEKKIDVTLTFQEDAFSMYGCLKHSPLRLHLILSDVIFKEDNDYADKIREIAPQFQFVVISQFHVGLLADLFRQKALILPPLFEPEQHPPVMRKERSEKHITLINGKPHKGLFIFLNLAKNLPERRFLVRGSSGIIEPYLK